MSDISAVLHKAKELCDRIMVDEGGLPPPFPPGNGGMISRDTLLVANQLRHLLAKAETKND